MDSHLSKVKDTLQRTCQRIGLKVTFEIGHPRAEPCLYWLGIDNEFMPLLLLEICQAEPSDGFEMGDTESFSDYAPLSESALKGLEVLTSASELRTTDPSYGELQFGRFTHGRPYKMIVQDYETKKLELEKNPDPRKNLLLFIYYLRDARSARCNIYYALNREVAQPAKPMRYHLDNVLYMVGRGAGSIKSIFNSFCSLFSSQKASHEAENSLKESLSQFGPEVEREGLEIHHQKLKPNLNPEECRILDQRLADLVAKMEYMSRNSRSSASRHSSSLDEGPRIIEWKPHCYTAQSTLQPNAPVSQLFQPLDF